MFVGNFTYEFKEAGTFFYTSNKTGAMNNVELKGKVIVTDKSSFASKISVRVGGILAEDATGAARK